MKYDNHCAGCGRLFKNVSFAIDKRGTLPLMYCDGVCRTLETNKKRIVHTDLTSDNGRDFLIKTGRLVGGWTSKRSEVDPDRMAQIPWQKYNTEVDDNVLNI